MFPSYEREAETLARNGKWYYSISEDKFLSYVPTMEVIVDGVKPDIFTESTPIFNMRPLCAVYEVTVEDNYPSSFLISSKLEETVKQYLDIDESLYVVVLENKLAPIIIGNKKALDRFVFPAWEEKYAMKPLQHFLKEGEKQ